MAIHEAVSAALTEHPTLLGQFHRDARFHLQVRMLDRSLCAVEAAALNLGIPEDVTRALLTDSAHLLFGGELAAPPGHGQLVIDPDPELFAPV